MFPIHSSEGYGATVKCIWCLEEFAKLSLEHAIPEALACPPDLKLDNVACEGCNNRLGVTDQALIKQFELFTVMYGVRRKGGKPPTIDTWRGIRSVQRATGPHLYINGSKDVVEADGKPLHPAKKSNGITNIWVEPEKGEVGISFKFGDDPRFLPALYKIGLNLVAKHFGSEAAAGPQYDHIRTFVRREFNSLPMTAAMSSTLIQGPITGASNPYTSAGLTYPMFEVLILGVTFVLDLAPDQPGLKKFEGVALLLREPLHVFPIRNAA